MPFSFAVSHFQTTNRHTISMFPKNTPTYDHSLHDKVRKLRAKETFYGHTRIGKTHSLSDFLPQIIFKLGVFYLFHYLSVLCTWLYSFFLPVILYLQHTAILAKQMKTHLTTPTIMKTIIRVLRLSEFWPGKHFLPEKRFFPSHHFFLS